MSARNLVRPGIIEDAEAKETGERFMKLPDRWFEEGPRWRCVNAHVSRRYLKSEQRGNVCLSCFGPLWLTFPEDQEAGSPFIPTLPLL